MLQVARAGNARHVAESPSTAATQHVFQSLGARYRSFLRCSRDWHDDTDYYNKTTITYLNQEYDGGRTIVGNYTVEPETGKIILFNSNIKHKVLPLIKGDRYVMLVWYNIKMNKK